MNDGFEESNELEWQEFDGFGNTFRDWAFFDSGSLSKLVITGLDQTPFRVAM
ncbi:MAG: hypothetical protein IPN13_10930 [Bacteroidetes bacterium]|nr:hypothetical protein [Bacteroidota bacterium]